MNYPNLPYRLFPLGDAAITVDFGNCIDEIINNEVIARFRQLQLQPIPGMIEAVPAYSSLTIYYDVWALKNIKTMGQTVFEWMKHQLLERLQQPIEPYEIHERQIQIPVCYAEEFATDIRHLAAKKNISVEEVVHIHTAKNYKVYMLGFLPGFAYMGEVDESIAMPRKPQPVGMVAGNVGIAGKQTGIYPLASPGGWQIIGRTPVKLFDAENEAPTLLRAGDCVQFYSITKEHYYEIQSRSLPGRNQL
ncbi:MAG: 5-oxoprolinase subunit PxpB [Chitinophagaceae bacterium]|nr:5-oxoprolinase subunit PxpB [Chitinophagaceae bacterium]